MRHACVTTTFYPTSEPKWEVRNCTASDAFWWSWREGTGKDSSDFNVPCDHVSGHHHGVVGYRGLPRSPLDPSTHAPSSCGRGGDSSSASGRSRRQNCEISILEHTRSSGRGVSFVFIFFKGHNPILERDPGITPGDFSSKWSNK